MTTLEQKNRRVGLVLALIALVMFAYSFLIIRRRGREPVPKDLTPLQRILRGL
jgi:uncharacterized membrane protein (UPF0136 family)